MGVRNSVLLALLPAVTQASELPARLTVQADPGAEVCPEKRGLAARVEAILHRPLGDDVPASTLAIDVRFQRSADGTFVARVTTRGRKPGQRLLRDTDPSCSALGEAVSVAIALLLDSALNDGQGHGEGETEESSEKRVLATPPAHPSPTPDVTASAAAASSESRSWQARGLLEAGGSYGLGGDGTLVGFGRLGVRHGSWVADVGAGGNVPVQQGFREGSVETSLLFASLRGCYLVGRSFAVGPCGGLAAGRLQGTGAGYALGQRSSLLWTAVGGGLAAEAHVGARVFASVEATLWVSTRRQTFSVENAGIAWESKPVAGALTAGLGLVLF
jgi:hypothetical protein